MPNYDQKGITYNHVREIFPEVISVGNCINVRNCKSTNVDLADGWCVICWDKGEDAKRNIKITADRREEEKKTKLLLKKVRRRTQIKGRHKKNCQCVIHIKKGF